MTGIAAQGEDSFEISGAIGPIRGDIFNAFPSHGTVIICHGFKGFARWGFFPHLARELAAASLNAVTFDFSGSGIGADRESTTEEQRFTDNTFSAELDDLKRVIEYSRERNLIDRSFGLFGHSRGGGIAVLHAASDPDVSALVTWASVSHFRRFSDAETAEWRRRGFVEVVNSRTGQVLKLGMPILEDMTANADWSLNVEAAAARIRAPWLILHGSADETVLPAEAERLHDASKARSTLRIVRGNHGFEGKHPLVEVPPALAAATGETVSFFTRNLTRA